MKYLVLLALALSACGGQLGGTIPPAPAAPSPRCEHVRSYYAALAEGGCTPYLPAPPDGDAEACEQTATDLDSCYADAGCWLALEQTVAPSCVRGLVPQWGPPP